MARKRKRAGRAQHRASPPAPRSAAAQEPAATARGDRRGRWIFAVAIAAVLAGSIVFYRFDAQRRTEPVPTPAPQAKAAAEPARYVGGGSCAACHAKEAAAWQGSHHERAMQEANERTVLGNFTNAKIAYAGVTSTFFRRDGKYYVNTDGPDGKLADYEIKYTFGITPLQQYLIEFPGGRLQALGIAWDARPKATGGQRWFHLYPKERVTHGDPLHWTAIDQNWNYQCAECHSTNLKKAYDAAGAVYHTTWSEIDVSCESCHGPGSAHVARARQAQGAAAGGNGLVVHLTERQGVAWNVDAASGIARRSRPRTTSLEIEVCARCHSRRGVLSEDYLPGKPLLDTHLPALLTADLYFDDGQIKGEVYEYGSFLQSRMHGAGVTCSDCHDPHSLRLRAEGAKVCEQCHAPAKFASVEHHHHQPGSAGADCLGCHMPQRTYMVVDPRRDHSLRVPRPDLSLTLGTPNACTACHTDKSAQWAASAFGKWYRPPASPQQRYAEALHAGREGAPGAAAKLAAIARDGSAPGIARATAAAELRGFREAASAAATRQALRDADPLVRVGALRALDGVDPRAHVADSAPLLRDSVRAVRTGAASLLAGTPPESLSSEQKAALDAAIAEYIAAQQINADRPEAQLNLGLMEMRRGHADQAERHYRQALKLQSSFAPAYVNLSDLYREQGRDDDGEKVLREAARAVPDDASVAHALGLALVRQHKADEALLWLRHAAERAPGNARYAYVYGVALNSSGQSRKAMEVLGAAQKRHPYDRDLLYALATMSRDAGNLPAAKRYATELVAAAPDDAAASELLRHLRGQ